MLEGLEYQAYKILRQGFDRAFGGPKFVETFPVVIDAGCGTGLAGTQVRTVQKIRVDRHGNFSFFLASCRVHH